MEGKKGSSIIQSDQTNPSQRKPARPHLFRKLLARRRKEPELLGIRQAAKKLNISRLKGDSSDPLDFKLQDVLPETTHPKLFGYYSASGIDYALRELGIYRKADQQGFTDYKVTVTGDAWCQTLDINGQAKGETYLLMEGRFRKHSWTLPENTLLKIESGDKQYSMITIEWFLLQNPLAEFSPHRPQLPGQKHPGLGIFEEVMEVFYAVARQIKLDGYISHPNLFHNAHVYSPEFFFADPKRQAELVAINRAGKGRSLQDLTLAVEGGFLYAEGHKDPYEWSGAPMIRPLSGRLHRAYLQSNYRQVVEDMSARTYFRFDWEAFQVQRDVLVERLLDETDSRNRDNS